MYNAINFDYTYSDPSNTTVSFTPLSFLFCPSDPGSHIDDASLGGTGDATTSYGTCDGDWYVYSINWGATNTSDRRTGRCSGRTMSRRIATVTDGLSNTLDGRRGLHRSCPDAKLHEFARGPFRCESSGSWSPPTCRCPARIRRRRWRIADRGLRHGHRQSEGRRADRTYPLGNGGVYYSGFTTAMPPNGSVIALSRAIGFRQRRPDRANGLGLR